MNSFDSLVEQEQVLAVVGQQHPAVADEQHAARPLRDLAPRPDVRLPRALVPGEDQLGLVARGLVLVPRLHRGRGDLGMRRRAARLDGGGRAQLQRPEGQVDPVAAQVAHRPVAEVPPAVPLRSGQVDVAVRAGGSRPEPQVPVDAGGNGVGRGRAVLHEHDVLVLGRLGLARVPAPRARHPDVALAHPADGACLHQLDDAAVVVAGVDLRAHLRRDAGGRGGFADDARLLHVVGERLLAVDVLPQLQRGQRGEGVGVLGGADHHGVELAGMVEETPEVHLLARVREGGGRLVEGVAVHVAQRGDVLARDALQVRAAPATAADDGEPQPLSGLGAEDGRARGPDGGSQLARGREERAASGSVVGCHAVQHTAARTSTQGREVISPRVAPALSDHRRGPGSRGGSPPAARGGRSGG